ncbi:MAG: winged helix-turn-helix transcriptional regulator [Candidatus Micrarchaeaceae archaeon]
MVSGSLKEYGYIKKVITRVLSEDCRTSITELSKKIGISRNSVRKYLLQIEKEFKPKYTIELDKNLLKIANRHFVVAKFKNRPSEKELKEITEKDINIQIAAITKGDFDAFFYLEAIEGNEYTEAENRLSVSLSKFTPTISPSYITSLQTGFLPSSEAFIKKALGASETKEVDLKIILELMNNARESYREISKKVGISEDSVRYRTFRLKEMGLIKRFTMAYMSPPLNHVFCALFNYVFSQDIGFKAAKARNAYFDQESELGIQNKYNLLVSMTGSYRFMMFVSGETTENALEIGVMKHKSIFGNSISSSACAEVKKIVKGYLPIRNIDLKKDYKQIKV